MVYLVADAEAEDTPVAPCFDTAASCRLARGISWPANHACMTAEDFGSLNDQFGGLY